MPNWLRALIAAYGAKKLGGCLSAVFFFVGSCIVLGQCNPSAVSSRKTFHRKQGYKQLPPQALIYNGTR